MSDDNDDFESRPGDRPTPSLPMAPDGAGIKLGRRGERFWATVEEVRSDGIIVCTVDNDLEKNPDLSYGQRLEVAARHVLEVFSRDDEAAFLDAVAQAKSAVASDPTQVGALQWREARL